jgi:hypothetical protein
MCVACAGAGFVAGSVIEKVSEGSSGQVSQASPEAYNLLSKSMEEMNKTIKSLEEKLEKDKNDKSRLQENLADVQSKLDNKNLPREPHETDEYLEEQKLFFVNELRKTNNRIDGNEKLLTQARQTQTETVSKGANVASDSINNTNWNNTMGSFKPSFTTKLIIAGAVVVVIYLLVAKH